MSYFIASYTSINKKDETITFTGGDNNICPRGNYKCDPYPFKSALIDLVGRSVHFGTNSDLHYYLEETVLRIDEEFGTQPHRRYANDTEGLWDYLCGYSVRTPELDIKEAKAIEDFRQACLNYVPDKRLFYLRRDDGMMISKASQSRIYFTSYPDQKKIFKGFRMANASFATKERYGFVPVLNES